MPAASLTCSAPDISADSLPLRIRHLGLVEYQSTWQQMQQLTDTRDDNSTDELWVLQHPRVFTLGQAGKPEHVLAAGDIPVIKVDRGGQVTYHGPGQLVFYPMLDIKRRKLGVRCLVDRLEQVVIDLLAEYDLPAQRESGKPGVYLPSGEKIAALGLRVRRGRSFHGLALNVDMDLQPYQRINPCGYVSQPVIDIRRALEIHAKPGAEIPDLNDVTQRWLLHFQRLLGYTEQHD